MLHARAPRSPFARATKHSPPRHAQCLTPESSSPGEHAPASSLGSMPGSPASLPTITPLPPPFSRCPLSRSLRYPFAAPRSTSWPQSRAAGCSAARACAASRSTIRSSSAPEMARQKRAAHRPSLPQRDCGGRFDWARFRCERGRRQCEVRGCMVRATPSDGRTCLCWPPRWPRFAPPVKVSSDE